MFLDVFFFIFRPDVNSQQQILMSHWTNYTYVILSACKLHIKEMLVYMTCNTDQIISWSLNQQLLILYNDKKNLEGNNIQN